MKLLISNHKKDKTPERVLSFNGYLDTSENQDAFNTGFNSGKIDMILMNFSAMKSITDHLTDPGLVINVKILDHFPEGFELRKESIEAVGKLSVRQLEILSDLANDYSYAKIAKKRFIELETVKSHVAHIYVKLGVSSRAMAKMAYYLNMCNYTGS